MKGRRIDVGLSLSLVAAGTIIWLMATAPRAKAIPAFSRKYQTSCATCHSNFPELNDFGRAFKMNGFKFPKDDDAFVKEPPVLLGAKAQKEAFPNALYPGELPGNLPIAFRYSGFAQVNSKIPLAAGFTPRTDLFAPNTFTIISAGSFGPNISFWIDDDISTGGSGADGGLGDGYIKANDIGHYLHLPKDALNVRFGQFELDLPFTQARTINLSDYDIYDQASVSLANPALCALAPVGTPCTTSNPFMFGVPQRGIEFGGYPNDGNFTWSVAIVNGNNDSPAVRNSKGCLRRAFRSDSISSGIPVSAVRCRPPGQQVRVTTLHSLLARSVTTVATRSTSASPYFRACLRFTSRFIAPVEISGLSTASSNCGDWECSATTQT